MANLILKPTSGGSLILQDEGGTAAHTIDASGNHTLSGTTNNLGTVTAGTLGAAVGFPSGHVLQVVQSTNSIVNTLTGSGEAEAVSCTFNRKIGTSHFIASASVNLGNRNSSTNQDGINPGCRWELNGADIVTSDHLAGDGWYFSDVPRWHGADTHTGQYDTTDFYNCQKFTLSGSANDQVIINVDVFCGPDGMHINRSKATGSSGGACSMIVMEVV